MMKVSVIVPVYNVSKYLDRCMECLLDQTLKEIEIILVDDESPDDCPQRCEEYAAKYENVKVVHRRNGGLGFARNSGLEVASGEYVAFLDSDDFVDVKMYEDLYDFAHMNDLDACFCGFNVYIDDNNIRQRQELADYTICEGQDKVTDVLLDMVGAPPEYCSDVKILSSVWKGIYKHQIIKENLLRFVSEREFIAEDIIFHLDFLPHCKKVGFIPQTYHYYCDNGASLTRSFRADRFEKELYQYKGMEARLVRNGIPTAAYIDRLDRYLLLKIRSCVSQIVKYSESLGRQKANEYIESVLEAPEVRTMTSRYPGSRLPLKHRIFFMLTKYKMKQILYVLMKHA